MATKKSPKPVRRKKRKIMQPTFGAFFWHLKHNRVNVFFSEILGPYFSILDIYKCPIFQSEPDSFPEKLIRLKI